MTKRGNRSGARGWLTKNAQGELAIAPDHVTAIKRIFELCLNGHSNNVIADTLNGAKPRVRPLATPDDYWDHGRVRDVLVDKLVTRHGLVTQDQFERARCQLKGNRGRPPKRKRGNETDLVPNLLGDRLYCGACKRKLIRRGDYGPDYLRCVNSSACGLTNIPCGAFELSLLAWLEFVQRIGITELHGTLELGDGGKWSSFQLPHLDELNRAYFGEHGRYNAAKKLGGLRRQMRANLQSLIDRVELYEEPRHGVAVHLTAWSLSELPGSEFISRKMLITGRGIDKLRLEDAHQPWACWYTEAGLQLEWSIDRKTEGTD